MLYAASKVCAGSTALGGSEFTKERIKDVEQERYDLEHLYLFLQSAKNEQFLEMKQRWGERSRVRVRDRLTYEGGGFRLIEEFSLGESLFAQDLVCYRERPVWMMNYYGKLLDEAERLESETVLELLRMTLYAVCKAGGLNGWMYRQQGGRRYTVYNYGGGNMYHGKGCVYKGEQKVYHYSYYGGIVSD